MAKMPLLEYVKSFYPSIYLGNVLLIGCQHILATTHSMLRSLYSSGLDPKNIFLLGKCYSSSSSVWQEMHQDGIHVSPLSFFFETRQSFDSQFFCVATKFLEDTLSQVNLSNFDKIILIDDGGQLLSLSMKFFGDDSNVVGIEQTTSGYEKIKSNVPQFPVINVARSQAKLIYESPLIAEAVVKKAIKRIGTLDQTFKKILIVGNGAIGSSIYSALKSDYHVQVYDKKLINNISFDEHLQTSDLIIGCTGETSLPVSKYKYLKKGCVLFSASSSDREFDAVHIRKKAKDIKSCHDDIKVDGITLLNCGFPINFDGGRNSVAPSKIQLTRTLLMAAILQACETSDTRSEIVPLDIEMQRDIISKYVQLYPKSIRKANPSTSYEENTFGQKIFVSKT